MKKFYKTAKIYQWSDIERDLSLKIGDVFDVDEICNYSAVPWEIVLDDGYDDEITVDEWLIEHGAEECEIVYIEFGDEYELS